MTVPTIHLICQTEQDSAAVAARIADILRPGDTLLLEGPIGAGKSAFARAVIRHLAGAEIEVPSPTFTLVQTYDLPHISIWHCDLYRLTDPDEALELGLDDAFGNAVCLIEWPDRLGDAAPTNAMTIHFAAQVDHHSITIAPAPGWGNRLRGIND